MYKYKAVIHDICHFVNFIFIHFDSMNGKKNLFKFLSTSTSPIPEEKSSENRGMAVLAKIFINGVSRLYKAISPLDDCYFGSKMGNFLLARSSSEASAG